MLLPIPIGAFAAIHPSSTNSPVVEPFSKGICVLVERKRFSAAPTRVSPAARTRPCPLQTCAPSRQSAKASMPPPMRRQCRSSFACHCRFARTEGSAAVSSAHHHHPHALAPVAVAAKARDPGRNIWSPTLELLALLNGGQSTGGAFRSGWCATPSRYWPVGWCCPL